MIALLSRFSLIVSLPPYSGSAGPIIALLSRNIIAQSARGIPNISEITASGNLAATSVTKSHSTPLATPSITSAVTSSIWARSFSIPCGVKRLLTNAR